MDSFTHTVLPTKPPGVVYALTELGREMVVPVKALGAWVRDDLDRIECARCRFDAEPTERKAGFGH